MTRHIIINGKFLMAEPTGVHRVAEELAHALAALKQEGHPALDGLEFELWYPREGAMRAAGIPLPKREVPYLSGIPWEQLTLPLMHGDATILSLCNIGPALARNAVTMIHDVQVHLTPASYRPAFRWWYHLIQPLFARRHRLILTVSDFSRQEIARVGLAPLGKVAVIHNGADHVLRDAADRSVIDRLELPAGGYVVALSSTQAHKNIGLLLRAFADPRLEGLPLVLFGGTRREAFEAAGHAIPPNVVFAGRVSDGELRALVEHALCLAFPSTTEGFGLPPVEAMLLGCPVISAPCGALPEVCGDAAVYAAPDSPGEWAARIAELRDDPARREQIIRSGSNHVQRFTWRESALELVSQLQNPHAATKA